MEPIKSVFGCADLIREIINQLMRPNQVYPIMVPSDGKIHMLLALKSISKYLSSCVIEYMKHHFMMDTDQICMLLICSHLFDFPSIVCTKYQMCMHMERLLNNKQFTITKDMDEIYVQHYLWRANISEIILESEHNISLSTIFKVKSTGEIRPHNDLTIIMENNTINYYPNNNTMRICCNGHWDMDEFYHMHPTMMRNVKTIIVTSVSAYVSSNIRNIFPDVVEMEFWVCTHVEYSSAYTIDGDVSLISVNVYSYECLTEHDDLHSHAEPCAWLVNSMLL